MDITELATPALIIDVERLDHNLETMAALLPGKRLRPHVKAHKCTALAAVQQAVGHTTFTCATPREVLGMGRGGVGHDLLLANESVDHDRLRAIAALDVRVTVAIDSAATLAAAVSAGIRACVIDVNVGLPRCGVLPEDAGRLADRARTVGLEVRGVMGYEGHLMMVAPREQRQANVDHAMSLLLQAHADVGGEIISAGGTGTFDLHAGTGVTEVQAGSYTLMDSQYGTLGLPFDQALHVLASVISVSPGWAVADAGLKAQGMDHGNPSLDPSNPGQVLFCSDEHVTFVPESPVSVGDRVRLIPAHVDPTMAIHQVVWLVRGNDVIDRWPIDLRGW